MVRLINMGVNGPEYRGQLRRNIQHSPVSEQPSLHYLIEYAFDVWA